MPRRLLLLIITLASCAVASGQNKIYDYTNLSAADIQELKAAHHAFYQAEAAGYQSQLQEYQQLRDAKVDGNQASFDIRYYGLHIALDFTTSTISGYVDYKIRSVVPVLNNVDLNLHAQLVVDSVRVGNTIATYSRNGNLLSVATPIIYSTGTEFDMTVYYHGTPYTDSQGRGMFFSSVSSGYPICYTMCSPFGARYWWPCKDYPLDKPDSVDIFVDRPAAYLVASNGIIVSDTASGTGRMLIHYKHNYPITTYLVSIACSEYVFDQQNWNYGSYSMPLVTYTYPSDTAPKNAFETWLPQVLTHLSNKFGTYPFVTEKAGSAIFGWGGAMEHQTCVYYNPTFYDSWVIAHENGHQWWGDMISASTFNHIWLKEGFASYSEAIFFESYYNSLSTYLAYMQTQKYLGPGTVIVENLETDDIFDPNLTYDKGSWLVHMLRGVLGDTTFFRVIREYSDSPYKYKSLTTEEFSAFVSSRVGRDMSWYFNEWVYGDGHPDYKIAWECERNPVSGFDFYYFVSQTQTGGTYFKMPIRTQFVTTAIPVDTTIWNEGKEQFYKLHFTDSVTNVVFDPQEWILRTITTEPFGMRIVSLVPPAGEVGRAYSWQPQVIGGTAPYDWSFFSGDLPYGLEFVGGTSASISGTPNYAATFYYQLRVNDSGTPNKTDVRQFKHVINKAVLVGDANSDDFVNISDVVLLIAYIFNGGSAPDSLRRGDVDCSGIIDISDAVRLIAHIFYGAPAPNCP
jgi:aminopeptidase N